jgi:hypothetical protein
MITRDEFRKLLDAYGAAAMAVAIQAERNRPEADQRRAVNEAANARNALENAVFCS